MKIEDTCKTCGKLFEHYKGKGSGQYCSLLCWYKSKNRVNGMAGKKHTEESKKLMSIKRKGVKKSEKTKKLMSKNNCRYWLGVKGKNNPHWKGGISRNKHSNLSAVKWRAKVFKRDNWTCQACGVVGRNLEAHHIKSWSQYPKYRYKLNNGVTLCKECHKLTDNYKGLSNKKK